MRRAALSALPKPGARCGGDGAAGWHSGWLPTASSLGLPVGLDKGHFLGGAGNVPSMPRFVVHQDFLPPQQQRGAPTRTPGLEERTLSGCSSSGPMADPPPLGRVAVLQTRAARTRLLPCALSTSGLFFRSEVCDMFCLSWLFSPLLLLIDGLP